MRRFIPLLIAGVVLVATACGDATAPTRSDDAALARVSGPLSAARNGYVGPNAKFTFVTIPAAGGIVTAGPFTVNFPANAVCNNATTRYGKAAWTDACTTTNRDVHLLAAYWYENGRPFVEFLADLRFDPAKTVTLSVVVPGLAADFDPRITYWQRDRNGRVVNVEEGIATSYDVLTGAISRRIMHFSGYVITSGREGGE